MALLRTLAKETMKRASLILTTSQRPISHLAYHGESEEETIERFVCFFNCGEIDGWDLRQGMNDLHGLDMVPDPKIIIAALGACRRVNDYALSVRFLEAVKAKCGKHVDKIYPYLVQEIAPTLCELGCDLPEALGYHKPELHLPSVF